MNGYTILADGYKQALEREELQANKQELLEHIKVLEFLASCSNSEIAKLFDSGAFNEITKAYCKRAMQLSECEPQQIKAVQDELSDLFSMVNASEITKK